jgi:hypothetical protein
MKEASMNGMDAFLTQLDHAWDHKFESVQAVLADVAEEEAAWQAPCYADEPPEEGWPLPGTVHWQVAHLAHCKRHYAEFVLRRREPDRPPVVPRPPNRTFAEELTELAAAHTALREAIAACTDDELDVVVGNGMPLREFLAMSTRHDTWHAGQIAVARRLYRTR